MNFSIHFFALSILGFISMNQPVAHAYHVRAENQISTLNLDATAPAWNNQISGQVLDVSGNPVLNARVVFGGEQYTVDSQGRFLIDAKNGSGNLLVMKAGFRKVGVAPQAGSIKVALVRAEVKGLYLEPGYLKSKNKIFQNEMDLAAQTELNAVTVDFKTDDGFVIDGLKPFIDLLHSKHVYAIARVVAFKDSQTVKSHPEWAITALNGTPWKNRKGATFLNPFSEEAQQYLIGVAQKAVEAGFDEVQYDYVRFPDQSNVATTAIWKDQNGNAIAYNPTTRTAAIQKFLSNSRKTLGAMGAFLAADVFGDTAFVNTDSGLGQRIEDIAPYLDYVCPMVYPSGYGLSYDGISHPEKHPAEIVADSIRHYRARADKTNKDLVIRPWLQAFRGYVEHTPYGASEISCQIAACTDSKKYGGLSDGGFLLWNAANHYTSAGLAPEADEESPLQ